MAWWTLQNLMLVALLAGVVGLVCRVRRLSPAAKHALWLVVLIKLLTPPLVVWPWSVPDPLRLALAAPPPRPPAVVLSEDARADSGQQPALDSANAHRAGIRKPPPLSVHSHPSPADIPPGTIPETLPEIPVSTKAIPLPFTPPPVVRSPPAAGPPITTDPPTAAATSEPVAATWPTWLLPLLAAVWLAGTIAVALLQAARILRMRRRLWNARAADGDLERAVAAVATRLGLRPIPVHVVGGIGTPLVWAAFRPRLVWPAELTGKLSPPARDGLIGHELAHVRRRDHWVGWLELLAGCLWWWNPLYWIVRHELREHAELACDAWVVGALPAGRRAYAEAILTVCEHVSAIPRTPAPAPALGMASSGRRALERRLTMILRERVAFQLSRRGVLAACLLAATALPAWSHMPAPEDAVVVRQGSTHPEQPDAGAGVPHSLFGSAVESGGGGSDANRRAVLRRQFVPDYPVSADNGTGADRAAAAVLRFEEQEGEARREMQRKVDQARRELLRQLEGLAAEAAREGRGGEAAAIGAYIQELRAQAARGNETQPDPGDLSGYRGRVGESFLFEVTGATRDSGGMVWGTDVYTDDSTLAVAAVHAGALAPGERGIVRVTILPGRDRYAGDARRGVVSADYGAWPGSYRVGRAEAPATPLDGIIQPVARRGPRAAVASAPEGFRDWAMLQGRGILPGERVQISLVGRTEGIVWGTDIYTDDSLLPAAAVHAGVLQPGQRGDVVVEILPGRESYTGSTRNGVTSHSYGPWGESFRFVRVQPPQAAAMPAAAPDRWQMLIRQFKQLGAKSFEIELVGATDGYVWGSDVYTDDSSLPAAAVHAGALKPGERGTVRVTLLEGRPSYSASSRNGVTSQPWGEWGGSFRVERAADGGGSVEE